MTHDNEASDDPRPLTSDELGDHGEDVFSAICTGGVPVLIANKSRKDKSGWDYIVEFPHDNRAKTDLDKRANPISAKFQQKSMWSDNDRIKFKLSALERIAKEPGPSFVCAMKFGNDLTCASCFLIHLFDEVLSRVLETLRRHEVEARGAINQAELSLYASRDGIAFEPNHAGLVSAINKAVGGDIEQYYNEKSRQLKCLGYEPEPYSFSFILREAENEKMIDALLGIKTEISADNIVGTETRFGISRPIPFLAGPARLTVDAVPIDLATVNFFKDRFSPKLVFRGDLYRAPMDVNYSDNPKRMRIDCKTFEITIRKSTLELKTIVVDGAKAVMNLARWRNHFSLLDLLTTGGAFISFRFLGKTTSPTVTTGPMKLDGDPNEISYLIKVIDTLDRLIKMVNADDDYIWSLNELRKLGKQMSLANAMFIERCTLDAEPVKFNRDLDMDMPDVLMGWYVTYVSVGANLIVMTCFIEACIDGDTANITFLDPSHNEPKITSISHDEYDQLVAEISEDNSYPLLLYTKAPPLGMDV